MLNNVSKTVKCEKQSGGHNDCVNLKKSFNLEKMLIV